MLFFGLASFKFWVCLASLCYNVQVEYLPPPPPLPSLVKPITEYELLKLLNIQKNNEKLKELSLPTLAVGMVEAFKKDKRKKKQRDPDEYVPENGKESEDD